MIPPGTAGEKAGEQLLTDRACTACHKLRDRDGGIAPDLTYEGLVRDDTWLMDHFRKPQSRDPGFHHAGLPLPGGRLPAHLRLPGQPEDAAARLPPAETYKVLCARCHGDKGDGNGKVA